ncbi:MAG: hypothetical protein AAB315_01730 [Pseudomonadota bacterium]
MLRQILPDDSRDGGRSGPSRPSRGITPSLEGRGRATPGAVAEDGGAVAKRGVRGYDASVIRSPTP